MSYSYRTENVTINNAPETPPPLKTKTKKYYPFLLYRQTPIQNRQLAPILQNLETGLREYTQMVVQDGLKKVTHIVSVSL